jgi:hypothetical protein
MGLEKLRVSRWIGFMVIGGSRVWTLHLFIIFRFYQIADKASRYRGALFVLA